MSRVYVVDVSVTLCKDATSGIDHWACAREGVVQEVVNRQSVPSSRRSAADGWTKKEKYLTELLTASGCDVLVHLYIKPILSLTAK